MDQMTFFDPGPEQPRDVQRVSRRSIATPAKPGTGPEGETCRTCKHYTLVQKANVYRKCGLMRETWTGGPGTDIKAKWPACAKWEAI